MDRKGFSLLETLFAIVVMAIIITPIPTLLTTITDSAKSIRSKDILVSTLSETMKSSTYRWDEHSQIDQKNANLILDTNSKNFARSSNISESNYIVRNYFFNRNYYLDKSAIPVPPRKFVQLKSVDFNQTKTYSTLPKFFKEVDEIYRSDFDDIDDWNGTVLTFKNVENKKIDYTVKYFVSYIDDNFSNNNSSKVSLKIDQKSLDNSKTSNLKLIQIIGTEISESQNKNIETFTLHYIASNIGEPIIFFKDINSTTLCTNQDEVCFCYLEAMDKNFTQAKCQ